MNCQDAAPLIHAYLDHELDPRACSEFEAHLSGCASCAALLMSFESQREALRRDVPRYAAPAELRARLSALKSEGPLSSARGRAPWALAAALLLSLALGAGGMYGLDHVVDARRTAAAFLPALVTSHLRALAAPSAVDVVSTDRHTVKPWFAGRVDQSPPVIDLADAGFPLVGGRIDYVMERRVPVVVYRRAQHLIDVYWFADGLPAPTMRGVEHHGYYAIPGAREDQRAWIVSDLDPVELARFAGLLQATAAPTAPAPLSPSPSTSPSPSPSP